MRVIKHVCVCAVSLPRGCVYTWPQICVWRWRGSLRVRQIIPVRTCVRSCADTGAKEALPELVTDDLVNQLYLHSCIHYDFDMSAEKQPTCC